MGEFAFKYLEDAKLSKTTENISLITGTGTAVRYFFGPWKDRFNFIFQELLVPVTVTGNITFSVPQEYPDHPLLHADSVTITGEGKASQAANGMIVWDRARIAVTYKTHNFNFSGTPSNAIDAYTNAIFLEESHDESVEFFSTGDVKLDGTRTVDRRLNFAESTGDIILKQNYLIKPPFLLYDFLKGHVNYKPFITPSINIFGAETIRYDGYNANTKVNIDSGQGENFPLPVWEVSHKFKFRREGWNKKRNEAGTLVPMTLVDDSKPFRPDDLMALFLGFSQSLDINVLDRIEDQIVIIFNYLEGARLLPVGTRKITDITVQNALNAIEIEVKALGFRI